jgi:hypothetical protein
MSAPPSRVITMRSMVEINIAPEEDDFSPFDSKEADT